MKYLLCTIVVALAVGSAAPATAKPRPRVSHYEVFDIDADPRPRNLIDTDPRPRDPEGPFHF